MNLIYIILFFLLFASWEKPKKLEDFRWENRVVLYFPKDKVESLLVADNLQEALAERKIVYIIFKDPLLSNAEMEFSENYQEQLKMKYQISAGKSKWVLIGLDGMAKLNQEGDLNWDLIFKTIDSMPMRQSEIRRKK